MATAGRPPTPIEQKRRIGTLRNDRLPPGVTVGSVVAIDAVEDASAGKTLPAVVEKVLEDGVHWLGKTDAPMLVLLRELVTEREVLAAYAESSMRIDARKALRDLDKQLMDCLAALGFTPAARARLGLAEVKAQSTLEKLRAKQEQRQAAQ